MWNFRSYPPMFARSTLYAIPGFKQLKTRFCVRVCAVLRNLFVVLTRTMRKICVEYQRSFAKMLPISRSLTTPHWQLADI
jgi:hypothetical protein